MWHGFSPFPSLDGMKIVGNGGSEDLVEDLGGVPDWPTKRGMHLDESKSRPPSRALDVLAITGQCSTTLVGKASVSVDLDVKVADDFK